MIKTKTNCVLDRERLRIFITNPECDNSELTRKSSRRKQLIKIESKNLVFW